MGRTKKKLNVDQKKFSCQGFEREYFAVSFPIIVCKPKAKEDNQIIKVKDIYLIIHQRNETLLSIL
jgi:hypothetical protein